MKKRKEFSVKKLLLPLCLTLCLGLMSAWYLWLYRSPSPEEEPELVLRYADDQPEDHPTTKAAHFFAEQVYTKTGGRIRIDIYSNGELGDERSVVEQVAFGGIDLARVSLTAVQDFVPAAAALMLPYSYRNAAHMWAVLDGELGDGILSELEEAHMVGLSWYDAGARSFYARREIRTLEDMHLLRIGIQDDERMRRFVENLDVRPRTVLYSNIQPGLQTGSLDGAENSLVSYQSAGHYKTAPYFLKTEHLRIPDIQIISQSIWALISPEDQTLILRCAKESAQYQRALWQAREREIEAELQKKGCTIIALSAEEQEKFRRCAARLYETLPVEYRDLYWKMQRVGK